MRKCGLAGRTVLHALAFRIIVCPVAENVLGKTSFCIPSHAITLITLRVAGLGHTLYSASITPILSQHLCQCKVRARNATTAVDFTPLFL